MYRALLSSVALLFTATADSLSRAPYQQGNYRQASAMAAKIHRDIPGDFYCGCKIVWQGNKGRVDLASCRYQVRKNATRAQRVEWEHVVPAWEWGHQRQCWQHGGRKNCAKDDQYRFIESDLHNLQPVVGEVNGDRGNFRFSQWQAGGTHYGGCAMVIDFKGKRAQPPMLARGAIARAYLYMRERYGLRIADAQMQLFMVWHKQFPVSQWECIRDRRIAGVQGNHNPYVVSACGDGDARAK